MSEYLDYDEVMHKYDIMMDWLSGLYVNILNLIQYMHDKYYYEASQMALIDTDVRRTFATGIAAILLLVISVVVTKSVKAISSRADDSNAQQQAVLTDNVVEDNNNNNQRE